MKRSIRKACAFAGAVGVLALAGCGAATATGTETSSSSSASETSTTAASDGAAAATTGYTDGTYTAQGAYQTPQSVETITVTVTLEQDVITSVDVTGDPQAQESQQYQTEFIGGIADEVVGVDIDDLSVDRVAGSSLTSTGFNEAIEEIKAEAAA